MQPIKTWDDADRFLADLGLLDSKIGEETNRMNLECQEVKKRHGEVIKNFEILKKKVLEVLEQFFIEHEDDAEVKGKTFEGDYGKCGLRMTPPSVKPFGKMTWERVLSRIMDLGLKKIYLRPLVHSIKDIDREFLASDKIDDGARKVIGVKLHQEERFWYEVK